MSAKWKALSVEERAIWDERAAADKVRYEKELAEYAASKASAAPEEELAEYEAGKASAALEVPPEAEEMTQEEQDAVKHAVAHFMHDEQDTMGHGQEETEVPSQQELYAKATKIALV